MATAAESTFAKSLEKNPVQINHYNVAEVKYTLDDAVRKILRDDHRFIEVHTHMDRKLLLGFSSCFFAIGGALYGHFNDFQESKLLVFFCIVLYSILNGGMLLYGMFVEKDTVFVGKRKDPIIRTEPEETVVVNAKCKKATAEYTITIQVSGKKKIGGTLTKSFGSYFDEEGEFVGDSLIADVGGLLAAKKKSE